MFERPDGNDGVVGLLGRVVLPCLQADFDTLHVALSYPLRLRFAQRQTDRTSYLVHLRELMQEATPTATDVEHRCLASGIRTVDVIRKLPELRLFQIVVLMSALPEGA
jgi:hypothetical protein